MPQHEHDSFEDDELDEAPSEEDIRRFDRDEAFCPDCGAQVYDSADVCPKCFAYLGGDTSSRPPQNAWQRNRMMLFVVIVILLAMGVVAFRGLFM